VSLSLLDSYTSDAMRMELYLRKDVELLVLRVRFVDSAGPDCRQIVLPGRVADYLSDRRCPHSGRGRPDFTLVCTGYSSAAGTFGWPT
jgi:hypothetical protein